MELPERSAKEILNKPRLVGNELPLELQSLIRGMRAGAIIMVVISIISVYFIPWAVFYIILATKLKPEELPSSKLVKWAAIATLPLCLGLIPIFIDIEFWKMNKHLIEYEENGTKAFKSDTEFMAGDKKRKRSSKITWIILISLIVIFATIIIFAVVSSSSNSTSSDAISSLSNSKKMTPYTSAEHGFKINFPGLPEAERQTLEEGGYKIPYTIYSADTNNGNKAYLVGVYDFTGIEINEMGALEGAVNGAVQNTKGATLLSSNFSTFQGLKSIDAHYTVPVEGATYDGYMKGFIKGGKMYAVFTIGENETGFNKFMDTFAFT